MSDPYEHHPELRDLIADPEASMFRKQTMAEFIAFVEEAGLETDWFFSDAEREASRAAAMEGRRESDLWFFGYGSLMWDPGIRFVEVRRAFLPDYARKFILKDTFGVRGSVDQPGLMAALDRGEGCHGVAFRIAQSELEQETDFIWRREFVAPAYLPVFARAETDQGPVEALTFLADHDTDVICADLSWDEKVRYAATGSGLFGTSFEYLANIVGHFEAMGIDDPATTTFHQAVLDHRAANGT